MSKQRARLIDILNPPQNPWLRDVSKGKIDPPAGVRVVRISGDGDDDSQETPPSWSPLTRAQEPV